MSSRSVSEGQLTPHFAEFENYRMTAAALAITALALSLIGAALLWLTVQPDVMQGGFGFVYHFAGIHFLALSCLVMVASIAVAAMTCHKRATQL